MRVVVMGRSLRGQMSGVVRYTDELVRALASRPELDLTVMLTQAPDGLDDVDVPTVRAPFPTPNEYARALWEQTVVRGQVRRLRPHVYHSPNYILPVGLPCPSVVTVHDLGFTDRSIHKLRSHLYLSVLTRLAVRQAAAVICVSHATAEALGNHYPDASRKVRVVTEGVAERFAPVTPDRADDFRRRHRLHRPYVLFVGTVEPRKNLPRLIDAFTSAVTRSELPHDLVIVGGDGWRNQAVADAIEGSAVRDRIRVLGYLDDGDLPAAYSTADLFAYPSLGEGFGLPPVEAMACGTAVITSTAGALPEVVGDAARCIDPFDTAALADGMLELLADSHHRQEVVRTGLEHSRRYRWDRMADQTVEVYREVAA